jgi:predicted NBD/HSP70 family sugar kinase
MGSERLSDSLRLTEQRVVAVLRGRDRLSRAELTAATGLPRTTVVATVAALLRRGVLAEHDDSAGKPRPVGRPSTSVALARPCGTVALVSFARSGTSIAVCNFSGTPVRRRSVDIHRDDDLHTILDAIGHELAGRDRDVEDRPSRAVISLPLPFRRGRGAAPIRHLTPSTLSAFPDLRPLPDWLQSDPSAAFADALGMPAIVENDANLAALGEAILGAGRAYRSIVFIALRDGIGAGLVFDGELHRGTSDIAGELAHVSVREDGQLCRCGNRGCLATLYRTPQLIDEISDAYGEPITFADMQTLAQHGDIGVCRILADLGRTVGRPLADLAVLLNPDAIVIDGALGAAATPVVAGMREVIDRYTPPMVSQAVSILPGELGDDAQLLGAIVLSRQHYVDELLGDASPAIQRPRRIPAP